MKKLNDYIEFLGLTLPVELTVKTKMNKKCDGQYLPKFDRKGKLSSHKITIFSLGITRDFNTLLAHELIHAKQEEMKQEEIHGKIFRKFAKLMEEEFSLEDIYIDGIDLN